MPKVINAKAPNGDGIVLYGQSLNDTLIAGNGAQTLFGTAGDDTLIGGAGNQQLYGGSDRDDIVAGVGNQMLDGGSGYDTVDFSKLHGKLDIDQDLYVATLTDPVTGAVINTYGIKSFEFVIGTDEGNIFEGAQHTARTYVGGAGADTYQSESGGDLVISGGGADSFRWFKIYVAVNHSDEIKDFQVGVDHLNLKDFLKGQYTADGVYMKTPGYDQVVRLAGVTDTAGHAATMVQALAGDGIWHNVVQLDGIDASTVTVADLVL